MVYTIFYLSLLIKIGKNTFFGHYEQLLRNVKDGLCCKTYFSACILPRIATLSNEHLQGEH